MFNTETEKKIVDFIKKSPIGVTSSDIARNFGLNRMTITKYLAIIKAKTLIDFKQFGMAKLWYIPVKLSKESFLSQIIGDLASNIQKEEFKSAAEKAGISLGESINKMYLHFYDTDKLTFDRLCDTYEDIGNKLGGSFKITARLNQKIFVEIKKNPFEEQNANAMNTVLSAVLAKVASSNLGYARAVINEPNQEGNTVIEVFLKKE